MKVEITQKQSKTINWNKVQLVKSRKSELVVLTNGTHSERLFTGTAVNGNFDVRVGTFAAMWVKELFEPFEGTLTITQ